METEPSYRPLEERESTRLIDYAQRNSGVLVAVEDSVAVEEALKAKGFEIMGVDIGNAIEGRLENSLEVSIIAARKVVPELQTAGITSFKDVLRILNQSAPEKKIAFLIRVPVNRPSQISDPAYKFLFSILKNGEGFSSRQRNPSHIAVLIYSGERRPYNDTYSDPFNECTDFERK